MLKTRVHPNRTQQFYQISYIRLNSNSILFISLPPTIMSTVSLFHSTTSSISYFPYPPILLVQHHDWYFYDADFFIIICGIIFGLHRRHFEQLTYFVPSYHSTNPDTLYPEELPVTSQSHSMAYPNQCSLHFYKYFVFPTRFPTLDCVRSTLSDLP